MFKPAHSRKFLPRLRLVLEELEARTLFSASPLDTLVAAPAITQTTSISATPDRRGGGSPVPPPPAPPAGFTPSQIQTAYGFNQISGTDYTGKTAPLPGTGQTIAIVDAYNDPNISQDLIAFDKQYGLPTANLTVAMPQGKPQTNAGWAMEISLDVEWAHAMAPGAKIVLVEAQNNSLNSLLGAVSYAANLQGVSVVSMSWGGSEFSSEASYDSYFTTPTGHTPVTFVASSGDSGAPPIWPAVSPNVVAVGGTSLTLNANNSISETGWSGSGGGISAYESLPSYQPGTYSNGTTTGTSTKRTNPDVAYNADPNTGYAIYDTVAYYGRTGWWEVGGTSAGAPQWSALIAIANQGRQLANNNTPNPLSGASQTLPALYNMSSSDFHDITKDTSTGTPYKAGPGYDLVTGLGTPYANSVVAALVSYGSQNVGGSVVTNGSGNSLSPKVAPAAEVVSASSPSPVSGTVALISQALAAAVPIVPAPTQTSAESPSDFSLSSLSDMAFRNGQAPVAIPGGTITSQTPASSSTVLGWQLYASAPNSASTSSRAFRPSPGLLPDADSADAAWISETGGTVVLMVGGPQAPVQTLLRGGQGDVDLVSPSAGGSPEDTTACDACFADEVRMALLFEGGVESAIGDSEDAAALRGPGLVVLALVASKFWEEPAAAESRKRRLGLLVELDK